MLLYIHGKNVPITPPLRAFVERKIRFALDRVAHRIATVRVRFDDINGPRGGIDKRCVIVVTGERGWAARAEQVAPDTLAALAAATDRLERLVARQHRRRRDRELTRARDAAGQ